MVTLGKWYLQQDVSYKEWSKREQMEIMKFRIRIYGVPAFFMVALIGFSFLYN